ncbi:MAG TPA: hypothetical protein VGF25_08020 [Thermoleophilaceae bacterium]
MEPERNRSPGRRLRSRLSEDDGFGLIDALLVALLALAIMAAVAGPLSNAVTAGSVNAVKRALSGDDGTAGGTATRSPIHNANWMRWLLQRIRPSRVPQKGPGTAPRGPGAERRPPGSRDPEIDRQLPEARRRLEELLRDVTVRRFQARQRGDHALEAELEQQERNLRYLLGRE